MVLTGRPYAGLIGSEIRHPAGDARVIMGEVDATNGSRHFEIFVGEDACEQDATPALDIQSQPNSKSPSPYTISLKGNTTVSGDVNVYGAVAFQPPDDAAKQQRGQPGTVYLRKGSLNPDGTTNPNTRDLSVELGRSGDEPTRFSVGVWSTENPAGFKPIFTVDANGNVTINGRLIAASVQPLPQGTALTNEVISLIRQRQLAARPISASAGGLIGDILQGIFGSRAAEAEARIDGRSDSNTCVRCRTSAADASQLHVEARLEADRARRLLPAWEQSLDRALGSDPKVHMLRSVDGAHAADGRRPPRFADRGGLGHRAGAQRRQAHRARRGRPAQDY
ncbi:MAG: hypothetical protein U0703_25040 [Anaerolineae bacterium]